MFISRLVEIQLKTMIVQYNIPQANHLKLCKKSVISSIRIVAKQSMNCDIVRIRYGTCQEILIENLAMHCVAAKFLSWLLSLDQKEWCVDIYRELHDMANNDPIFISKVITRDANWFLQL